MASLPMEAADLPAESQLPPAIRANLKAVDKLIGEMVAGETGDAGLDHKADHSQAQANKLTDRREEVRRLVSEHRVGEPLDRGFVLAMVDIIDADEIGKDTLDEGMSPEAERYNVHKEVIYLRHRNSDQSAE